MRIELLLFLSFLALIIVLIACSVPRRPTLILSPTLFPQLTLTTYDPQLATRVSMEAKLAATVLPAKPRLPEIDISPPRCYRTISPQLTCFGYLYNRAKVAISDISLRVNFTGADGLHSGAKVFRLEQRRISADGSAPYRLLVPDSRLEQAALAISLENARLAPSPHVELALENVHGDWQFSENSFRLQGWLRNASDVPVRDIRLVVTLVNGAGAIIGFRAVDLPEALPVGAALPVDVSVTALEQASAVSHHVAVHGLSVDYSSPFPPKQDFENMARVDANQPSDARYLSKRAKVELTPASTPISITLSRASSEA